MFNLTEYIKSICLDEINIITLKYYSSKSDIMSIYDTNFIFNEDIVPLLTSVLELSPTVINAKRYNNINSESIITFGNENELSNKSQTNFPCFFSDIKQNNLNMKYNQGYNRKLIKSLDITNISETSNETSNETSSETSNEIPINILFRMYKLEQKKGDFSYNMLNEEELTIIIWNWEFANFQIIINKQEPTLCQLQINIYVTEDNNIIISKLEKINNIIDKITKIKDKLLSRIK